VIIHLAALATTSALAATVSPVFPSGPPRAGEPATFEVLVSDGALPVPDLRPIVTPRSGTAEARGQVAPGLWRYRYVAPGDGDDTIDVLVGTESVSWPVSVASQPVPVLALSGERRGSVRRPRFRLEMSSPLPIDASALRTASSEGRLSVIDEDGALWLEWAPPSTPFPRAVPVGVLDAARPGAPTWAVFSLQAGLPLPIQTAPESAVSVRVGRRVYGPFRADAEGYVTPTIEVRPGESVARVTATDPLGNQQVSTVALGGSLLPSLVGIAEGSLHPDLPEPAVHLLGIRSDGRPWRREGSLSCTNRRGDALSPVLVGDGQWRVPVPVPIAPIEDERISCVLDGQARAQVTVPLGSLSPTQLLLRVDPPHLSADAPTASVRAHVEDHLGQRGPVETLSLTAEHGELESAAAGNYLAGLYSGERAAPHGGDTITATWVRPSSTLDVWQLQLSAIAQPTGEVLLGGRALDRHGEAVRGAAVTLRTEGVEIVAETDATGWASVLLPKPNDRSVYVSAHTGVLDRYAVILPGQSTGRTPSAPDLRVTEQIRVNAGRIRGLFVTTEPRIIAANSGIARVEVRPVDAGGNPVLDEDIVLKASAGRLSMIEPEPNGSYFATYTPPEGVDAATVEITASTVDGDYAATTDLTILPRIFEQMFSVSGGTLWNGRAASLNGWGSARYARQLPWSLTTGASVFTTWWHLDVGGYALQLEEQDGAAELELLTFVNTSGPGASVRRQQRRNAAWGGVTISPNVSWTRARLGGEEVLRGWRTSLQPAAGVQVFAGVGWQLGSGEWMLELRAFSLNQTAETIGWEAQVGGFSATAGYNFFF